MEYVINNSVNFNSSVGTLSCQDGTIDMITLNRVSNELLFLFIQNIGVPISRDKLLKELWEKKGLSASNNNLNNYVSILRKTLEKFGCSGVISTIPKYGFLFEADVLYMNPLMNPSVVNVTEYNKIPLLSPEKKRIESFFLKNPKINITVFILFLIATVGTTYIRENLRLSTLRNDVFHHQQCRFYLIDDKTRQLDRNWVINRIKFIINDQKISFAISANVYYSADIKRNVLDNYVLYDMLAHCAYKSKAPCENYTYSIGEGKYESNK